MVNQVTTMTPVSLLADLKHEWRVIAFRPNNLGEWRWYITPLEREAYTSMVQNKIIISAHRRDRDGTRLLAKVRGKSK